MEATAEDTPKDSAENVLPENNIAVSKIRVVIPGSL